MIRLKTIGLLTGVVQCLALACVWAQPATQKGGRVALAAVPDAARQVIEKEVGDSDLRELKAKTEDETTVYEAKWRTDNAEVKIEVDGEGTLLKRETKRQIEIEQVPSCARGMIRDAAGENQLSKLEEKAMGHLAVYKAEWLVDGKKQRLEIAAEIHVLRPAGRRLTLDEVPPAVKETVLRLAGDAKLKDLKGKAKGGRLRYEAEWVANGVETEIEVSSGGEVLDTETKRKVTVDQVPAAVKRTILGEAGDSPLTEIEEATKNGKATYEAEWLAGGKEIELKIAADGTLLKREVDDEDEEQEGEHED